MRWVGFAIGIGLVGLGAFLLITGLRQVLDFPSGDCFGPDCFDFDAAFFTLPFAIFALVIGGIVLSISVAAIKRSNPGAFGGLGSLSALGAVFDVLGGAFLIIEFSTTSVVDGTFLFMGITFFGVGAVLLAIDLWLAARRRRANRLRASGKRGTATILGVSDSNITINNDPIINLRLRVSIPNHPPYEVTKRQLVSRIAVGRFAPGATLAVLVDPADPDDVMIDEAPGSGTPMFGDLVQLGTAGRGTAGLTPDLMSNISNALRVAADQFATDDPGNVHTTTITVNGQTYQVPGGGQSIVITPSGDVLAAPAVPAGGESPPAVAAGVGAAPVGPASPGVSAGVSASAAGQSPSAAPSLGPPAANGRVSIESLTDTGTQLGEMRLFSFELTVSPAGAMPYRASHAALVPTAQVPRLIRGASFPAVIDARLPGGLGIFWDR